MLFGKVLDWFVWCIGFKGLRGLWKVSALCAAVVGKVYNSGLGLVGIIYMLWCVNDMLIVGVSLNCIELCYIFVLSKINDMEKLKKEIEELIDSSKYLEAAELVAKEFDIQTAAEFMESRKYFDDDKEERDVYSITLCVGSRSYKFRFGQRLNNSGCYVLQGKYKTMLDRSKIKNINDVARHIRIFRNIKFGAKLDKVQLPITPTIYDILVCLTKQDPDSFENFCSEYGYDTYSGKAEKTYNAVCDEWLNVSRLFNDEQLEVLQLIQ